MDELRLVSEIPPSVNHYLAYRAIIKGGKPVGMSYKTTEAKQYAKSFSNYVSAEVKNQGWDVPLDKYKHFYAEGTFYFDKIDLDPNNYWKVMLDAITDTHLVWVDDNVVCERVKRIFYDASNPRIELVIHPVEYIGVFDNQDDLSMFESRCKTCTRYCRNCSLLRDAKIGRIQPEIHDLVCDKYSKKKGAQNE